MAEAFMNAPRSSRGRLIRPTLKMKDLIDQQMKEMEEEIRVTELSISQAETTLKQQYELSMNRQVRPTTAVQHSHVNELQPSVAVPQPQASVQQPEATSTISFYFLARGLR